jgi:methylthioribose-1-phosphate isomerase
MRPDPEVSSVSLSTPRTIDWIGGIDGFVRLIDQTLLPTQVAYRDCRTVEEVWEAIRTLRVRGAPAIGIAAAFGVVVGVQSCRDRSWGAFQHRLHEVADYLRTSRPTAVNLFWALDRMERCVRGFTEQFPPQQLTLKLLDEARAIAEEDRQMCRAIGRNGSTLIHNGPGRPVCRRGTGQTLPGLCRRNPAAAPGGPADCLGIAATANRCHSDLR